MSLPLTLALVLLAIYTLVGALDLGVGLLLPLVARGRDRDAVLAMGGRPWLAGATWTLVIFSLTVAGFPESLAPLLPLWPVLASMLLSLAIRGGVAALRPHVLRQDLVDLVFGLASLVAAGCLGLILGWFIAGLGSGLPTRHAGPLGAASIWGLLCAAGTVGLSALLGSGWLVWSGRDAVRVLGREVGRAAVILFAASAALCSIWALPTGVAARHFAQGWLSGSLAALSEAATLALLVPFSLSLWGRREAAPFACAALAGACGFVAFAALASFSVVTATESALSGAYLALVLLIGLPLVIIDLLRRTATLKRGAMPPGDSLSHAGRRVGSLANSLHLS